MRFLNDMYAPYRIRVDEPAARQLETASERERHELRHAFGQLADLAAFAVPYVRSAGPAGRLYADAGVFSLEYDVDDAARLLTVRQITRTADLAAHAAVPAVGMTEAA